jgi:site-specific DNA-methyltransferase (adenine-specific)
MAGMRAETFDAVVTDPPYSSGGAMRGDRMASSRAKYVSTDAAHSLQSFSGDNRDQRGYLAWSNLWMSQARRISKPGAMLCVFTDWRQLPITTDAVQAAGWVWRGIAVWTKKNARPCKGRYAAQAEFIVWATNGPRPVEGPCASGCWIDDTPRGDDRVHITQKPVDLMRGVLSPLLPRSVILDPFAGSGSTGVAAMMDGFDFVGIEQDAANAEVARARIAAIEPTLIGGLA